MKELEELRKRFENEETKQDKIYLLQETYALIKEFEMMLEEYNQRG